MMDLVLTCAVPLGFVSALMEEEEYNDEVATAGCCSSREATRLLMMDRLSERDYPHLPDLVMSTAFQNVPRASFSSRSRLNLSPSSGQVEIELTRGEPSVSSYRSWNSNHKELERESLETGIRNGVDRIQELRLRYDLEHSRRVASEASLQVSHPQHRLLHNRQQSLRDHRQSQFNCEPRIQDLKEEEEEEEEVEEEVRKAETFRDSADDIRKRCGISLQQIADQFEADNAKMNTKESKAPYSITVPALLTRCLSASFVLLVGWRLYNKFR